MTKKSNSEKKLFLLTILMSLNNNLACLVPVRVISPISIKLSNAILNGDSIFSLLQLVSWCLILLRKICLLIEFKQTSC